MKRMSSLLLLAFGACAFLLAAAAGVARPPTMILVAKRRIMTNGEWCRLLRLDTDGAPFPSVRSVASEVPGTRMLQISRAPRRQGKCVLISTDKAIAERRQSVDLVLAIC